MKGFRIMSEELKNTEITEGQETETQTEETKGKLYTEDELQALLQKEGDRRISLYQKTMERKQREADRLRNMSAEDKREYELQQRELAIEAKEQELALLENKSVCISILADKGISSKLVDFVVDSDADVMNEKIKLLEKEFKKSVKEEVERRLVSKVPTKSLPTDISTITKEQFQKMSYSEIARLKAEQPELWEQLSK